MEQTSGDIGKLIITLYTVYGTGWAANVDFVRLGMLVHVILLVLHKVELLNFE